MPTPTTNHHHHKINQIVRLKQVMQRWRRRCTTTTSDTDSTRTPSPGTLAVYIGPERRRFIIPTSFLNLPVFVALLNKAEEEYGFQRSGGLIIPCEVIFFKKLLRVLEINECGFKMLDLEDFNKMFDGLENDSLATQCNGLKNSGYGYSLLLSKTRA